MRLEVLSDQGDTLRMSLIHTFLLTAYLYTTFVMVSTISANGCGRVVHNCLSKTAILLNKNIVNLQ